MPEAQHFKRNITILTIAQALGAASPPIIISLGGIIGRQLAPDNPDLATIPVSMYHIGIALSTLPAVMLMQKLGRRHAYMLACMLGIASGLIAAFGIRAELFMLFCLGTLIAGFFGAFVQSYRFAAIDSAPSNKRGQAITCIMIGGLIAAIIGPELVIRSRDLFPSLDFAAAFLSQSLLALLALPFLACLVAPKIKVAPVTSDSPHIRTTKQLLKSPTYSTAVAAAMVSYGLMAFLMTATPMAMLDHHHSIDHAAAGIRWHVLAMYGPSFFTGMIINRFGARNVTACGLLILCLSALITFFGYGLFHFWSALILLGLGWNFGFFGATTLVTSTYQLHERSKAQGLNDFIVFGSVALASLFSGVLMQQAGWLVINALVFPIVLAVLIPLFMFFPRES